MVDSVIYTKLKRSRYDQNIIDLINCQLIVGQIKSEKYFHNLMFNNIIPVNYNWIVIYFNHKLW